MAKCPGKCDSFDGSGKVWCKFSLPYTIRPLFNTGHGVVKVFEQGLISGTENAGIWAGDAILDTLYATITIPATLAPGDYLIRHELIAVHQANNPQCTFIPSTTYTLLPPLTLHTLKLTNQTQVYPECAQFTVTGSGTASPPASALVSFPGAYSSTDPGIAFNIDSDAAKKATSYPIPGPTVWNGSGDPSGPTTTITSAAPVSSPPSPTTLVTSASAAPTTTPTCEVARYGQCGGKGFGGCTACASGSTCVANGEYYSQCV